MRTILVSLVLAAMLAAPSAAQSDSAAAFEKMKSLAGEWEGKTSDGKIARLKYEVTSGGSALVETLSTEEEYSMVTVYHRDGNRLMMTHYCGAGN